MTQPSARDDPWIFRTYAGHSTAKTSNLLFKSNLSKGQTGLSVAFDLPTQLGYDCDHPMAQGEVGRVGVPISHLGDMRALFDGIPIERMNTSMTINATAAWLLALYVALARERGLSPSSLSGTVQNDIIKEYLSRGAYVFPPRASMKLTIDVIEYCAREIPKWNPINVCSYHLQEAGATPAQEVAYALATAIAILDEVKADPKIDDSARAQIVGRISFFVNSGIRFVTELCKIHAFAELWDELCRDRYKVTEEKLRRFRYGVQVNSLGLTEQQPENNVYRILIEMLGVVLSKKMRARAIQLPSWNEALGLPRSWDQQWSLRMQQILAFETDLLEHEDLFEGSLVIAKNVKALKDRVRAELDGVLAAGGAISAVENGFMKSKLVQSQAERMRAIESGALTIVGVNAFTETEPSQLAFGDNPAVTIVNDAVEFAHREELKEWRNQRDKKKAVTAIEALRQALAENRNVLPPSIECARVGVTTGEWGAALRSVFGEYRAPTGVSLSRREKAPEPVVRHRARVAELSRRLQRPVRILIGKPGLDGHSNGAEQIAERAADCGIEVIFEGIRQTPQDIFKSAIGNKVLLVGLSILSGSHVALVRDVIGKLRQAGAGDIPVIAGGIIPEEDIKILKQLGVVRVYTPKDHQLDMIITDILDIIERQTKDIAG